MGVFPSNYCTVIEQDIQNVPTTANPNTSSSGNENNSTTNNNNNNNSNSEDTSNTNNSKTSNSNENENTNSPATQQKRVRVVYSFTKRKDNEMSIAKGDIITVLEESSSGTCKYLNI